jgi:hypothetical protein
MSETTLRRTLPEAYTIGLVGADNYWGFLEGGAGVVCAAYADGTYLEDVAETGDLPGLADRTTLAEERYLLLAPSDGAALRVWDVVANTVAAYAAPAGYQIVGAGAIDGVVYWIEWPEQDWAGGPTVYTSEIRLMGAGFDLATPVEVTSVEVSDNFYWEWRVDSPAAWFALNAEAALAERVGWDVVNNEVSAVFRVRLPLSGAGGTFSEGGAFALSGLSVGVPRPGGGSLFASSGAAAVVRLADDVAPANDPISDWPEEELWALPGNANNVAVSPDEEEAVAYGLDDGPTLIRGDVGAGSGAPRKRFAVEDHLTELSPPDYMYPRSA